MTAAVIAELDERSLILALQEVTEDLTADVAPEARPMDRDEAEALLAALLEAGGHNGTEAADLNGVDQYAAARRLLVLLVEDPATADVVRAVVAEPPSDTRLGTDLAVPAVVVLAGVVGWLQTKIDVRIKRKDGKSEFEFRATKAAARAGLLKELAATVVRLWNGPPQQ
ncbi:hypothetical protein [Embleya sp. NPDC050493]|uniref:hypothetical protein n=1 Tax=Embleya sp. NPDC050493 TaxID=3363989 RepID=UPI00378F6E00